MGVLLDAVEQARRVDDLFVEGLRVEGEAVGDALDAGYFEFHHLVLDHCDLAGAKLAKSSFYDCTLQGCDLSNANLQEAYFSRCELVGCKLEGAQLVKAILRSTRLEECVCRYGNWGEATLEGVRLQGCDLREAFLNEVRLRKRTRLEECDLRRADLFRTKLRGIDLSTCAIAGITVSDTRDELHGACIAAEQAVDLVGMLGVRVIL